MPRGIAQRIHDRRNAVETFASDPLADVLDDERADLASSCLQRSNMPREDVGFLLGIVLSGDRTWIAERASAVGSQH
jgi:hypothetical protein